MIILFIKLLLIQQNDSRFKYNTHKQFSTWLPVNHLQTALPKERGFGKFWHENSKASTRL
jgi:hypothetical protein